MMKYHLRLAHPYLERPLHVTLRKFRGIFTDFFSENHMSVGQRCRRQRQLQQPPFKVFANQVFSNRMNDILTEGKQWKSKSAPNKNPSLRTAFSKRITKDKQKDATKALERQLNEERKAA